MDDDSRPRRHLAKPPADKSPAGQLLPGPLPSGKPPAASLPASTVQDRSDRRTRRPEPEPVYAALLRASGLRPPPGQYEASDVPRKWSSGASPAPQTSARPAAARPSASERNPRLAAGGLLSDPLAASLDSPLAELASPHPYTRSYRIQLLVPDEKPADGPAGKPADGPADKPADGPAERPADPGFLACPVAGCFPAQPDMIARSSPPQPPPPAPAGDRHRESDPAQPLSPARAAGPVGGTSGADAASASDRRGASGQASALDRRPVSYWATAWEYAGARAGSSVGRHRRFSDRVPRWRRTLLPGGS
jgi:hypothetical protein